MRKVIPPSGPAVAYSYDIEDQLLQVQRGGATTSLSYDLGGRKLQMNDPDMGVWNYTYDALGNLTRQADARGQRICLYYDGLNRLTGKQYRTDDACPSNPTLNVTYTYDSGTYAKGYRTGMVDPSGSTSWTYDPRGRIIDKMKTVSGVGPFHSAWSYNSADLLASQVFPADASGVTGEILTYSYHPQAALKSVYSNLGYYYVQNMTYDAAGRVDLRKLGAANLGDNPTLLTDFDYYLWNIPGGQGRLQRLKSGTYANATSLQDFSYTYDVLGNVLSIVDAKAGGTQTQSYSYDLLDRLLFSQASEGNQGAYPLESYSYDPVTGNLSTKAGVSYSYAPQSGSCPQGALSKPHAVTGAGTSAFCYDQNGNMVRRTIGANVYNLTYDAENRLTAVSGAATVTFVYDGDGNRVKATVGGATTTYIGDSFEWSGSTATMKKYYSAGGTRVAVRTGSTLNWLLDDHLGSTNITANNSAIEMGKLLYKPWGEERFSSGTTPTTFKFTGQRQESSFGLYLFGSRWYDPSLGRWASPDIIISDPYNPQDWDRYSFVRNNPLKYVDPDGHNPLLILALIGAAIFFSQIPSDQYQPDPANWGDPGVQLFGLSLMLAPAIVPAACLNDGDCTNEANAAAQASPNASQAVQGAQSVWNMNPFARGTAIENMLGRSPQLVGNFPVIDRFQNGVATSIKSIDLFAKTYQNISNLTRAVQRYVNTLANWQGATWGDVTIKANEIVSRKLLLAVPPNPSGAQLQALQQLQRWALKQGVTLTLVTVK